MAKRSSFTHDEIVLCIYAARYDAAAFGGLDAVSILQNRSRASIVMKIRNIVSMCDEEGISRWVEHVPLSGASPTSQGRRTNWEELSAYARVAREQHLKECLQIIERRYSWPGEISESQDYAEGVKRKVLVNSFERNPTARKKCLEHFGTN